MSETTAAIPLADVQGGIFDPTELAHEVHLFLQVRKPNKARKFIRSIVDEVSTEAVQGPDRRLNVGFTHAGLAALGVDAETLDSFPVEFQEGMSTRAPMLGDNGASAPSTWEDHYQHGGLHVWLMLQDDDRSRLGVRVDQLRRRIQNSAGVHEIGAETADQFGAAHAPAKEHFGFNDNLSQPGVAGVGQPIEPGQGTYRDGEWHPIETGCFLLGHRDGYGNVSAHPSDPELRTNGTYMVLRKLEQDVAGFRSYVDETAELFGMDPELCAAKFVGRWRSGAPLQLSPDGDDPGIVDKPDIQNDFVYQKGGDDDGGCPVPHFAHIRRANPRDALGPDSAVDVANHRIIRRSAPYGSFVDIGTPADDTPRGLIFRAFNASIRDQFELIQSQWINSANEAHGLSSDRDPFVGNREHGDDPNDIQLGASFTIPQPDGRCPSRYGLPRFVTVKGGAYFFVPSLTALHALGRKLEAPADPMAGLPTDFVARYKAVSGPPDGPLRSVEDILRAQITVVLEAQQNIPAMAASLRGQPETEIFETPMGFLLSRAEDSVEALTNDEVFSVSEYGKRMSQLAGPFMLGMDPGPDYENDHAIMRMVAPSSDLPRIKDWIDGYAKLIIDKAIADASGPLGDGTFDLVPAIANRLPLAFVDDYFGVPGPSDTTMMSWLQALGCWVFEFCGPWIPGLTDAARGAGSDFARYLDELVDDRIELLTGPTPDRVPPDDGLTKLVRLASLHLPGPHPDFPVDKYWIRRNLAGFTLGSVIGSSMSIVGSVGYLLADGSEDALAQTRAAVASGDDERIGQCMMEAVRLGVPPPPALFRTTTRDHVMAPGTSRETLIPEGSYVAIYPAAAMTDPRAVDDHGTFRPGRPLSKYLTFGAGTHECFGTAIAMMFLTSVAKHLLSIEGLRQVRPAALGEGLPAGLYPGTYPLTVEHPSAGER